MAGILLGFPDEEAASEPATAFDNFLGGTLVTFTPPESVPVTTPTCTNCSESSSFIMQLYCPLGDHHRSMYFFSCLRKECQKLGRCWRAFRLSTKLSSIPALPQKATSTEASDCEWKLDDNDELDESVWFNTCPTVDVAAIADSKCHEILHIKSPFLRRFIQVYDEETPQGSETQHNCLSDWVLDYQAEEEFVSDDEADADIEKHMTSRYQLHLATRDPAYGCEAVRYAWCGQPIFASAPPQEDWAPHLTCRRCGGPRAFEVQLFSSINNSLTLDPTSPNDDIDASWPLDMATLIVFSCKASCESDQWTEECVLVQTERGESVFCGT
ncbi:unnamed protein product [Mesocestoides corti]|uniref:PDCD2_C domain-containing protein n=1 Tax=Mesocestoides corti TaxID=53468 RepID=A0A0R3UHF0_MESCO|nr:unnamed protein product [Mesocestoides corti]